MRRVPTRTRRVAGGVAFTAFIHSVVKRRRCGSLKPIALGWDTSAGLLFPAVTMRIGMAATGGKRAIKHPGFRVHFR